MIEYLYIPLVLLLYSRTWRYKYLIDDQVPRSGYLWVCFTGKQDNRFQETQRPLMAAITNVGVFLLTCWGVHLCFGWKAALVYSLMPTNVSGVAWITGNYYMTTVWLILVAYYLSGISPFLGLPFYWVGLESTISAVPFAMLLMMIKPSWENLVFFMPLGLFLFGKRFRTAIKLRKKAQKERHINAGALHWRNIFIVPKVLAYYTVLNFWPSRLGFFPDVYKEYENSDNFSKCGLHRADKQFWLGILFLALFAHWSNSIHPIGMLWWFLFIGMWCQFAQYGQFISERYMYLANVGFAAIMAAFIANPVVFAIYTTLLFYRTWLYIPAWRHNKILFAESMAAFPYAQENYNNLASYYEDKGLWVKAVEPLLMALRYTDKYSFNLNKNISNAYIKCGQYEKALFYARCASQKCPEPFVKEHENTIKELGLRLSKIQMQAKKLKKLGII